MVHQKTYNALIVLIILLFFFGCKKLSKEYTTARWEIINPVTNTPYVGVPVRLFLADNRGNSPKYETIWEGETNSQGIAEYNFRAYMNTSFSYLEQATLAPLGTLGFDYSIIRRPSVGGAGNIGVYFTEQVVLSLMTDYEMENLGYGLTMEDYMKRLNIEKK